MSLVKIVFFSPAESVQGLLNDVFKLGAGIVGSYSNCAFSSSGVGQYMGDETSSPTVGKSLELCQVAEERVEFICPKIIAKEVISTLRLNHPYEEAAIDVYELLEI